MKIDWKELSKSEGYKSLKKSYIRSVSDIGGDRWHKESALDKFNWSISRAKHYSHVLGISLADILYAWESERTYSFQGYYQEYNVPKLKKESVRRSHEAKIRNLLSCRAEKSIESS